VSLDGLDVRYDEGWAARGGHRIYVCDYPGEEPAVVLMHGFPDNLHLYDRLVPRMRAPFLRAARNQTTGALVDPS
jgi:pimeloyl-ACP methyl ester carboxylesterase